MLLLLEVVILAAATTAWSAPASRVPKLNVEPACRAVANLGAPVADMKTCLEKERAAHDRLAAQWNQIPPADRDYCQRLATLGGHSPTYTELLTCVELQREVRKLRAARDLGISERHEPR
jgi:hypothetical protein